MKKIIMLHMSFRTSSTWMWLKFREYKGAMAFYEFYHEMLETIDRDMTYELCSNSWELGHPASKPYFLEFISLLKNSGGVINYKKEFAYQNYFPTGGLNGNLSIDEINYVNTLVDHANKLDLIPILACTRTLGRIAAFQHTFNGVHILGYRNLYEHLTSFLNQKRRGNTFFIETILQVVNFNESDHLVKLLKNILSQKQIDLSGGNIGLEDFTFLFLTLHLYLYMYFVDKVDLVVNVSNLVDDQYRQQISDSIYSLTEIKVDLSDYQNDFYFEPLPCHESIVDGALEFIINNSSFVMSSAAVKFGQELATDFKSCYQKAKKNCGKTVDFFIKQESKLLAQLKHNEDGVISLHDNINKLHSELSNRDEELNRLNQESVNQDIEINRLHKECANLDEELNRLNNELSNERSEVSRLHYEIHLRNAEIERLNNHIGAIYATISWKITQPIRILKKGIKKIINMPRQLSLKIKSRIKSIIVKIAKKIATINIVKRMGKSYLNKHPELKMKIKQKMIAKGLWRDTYTPISELPLVWPSNSEINIEKVRQQYGNDVANVYQILTKKK